MMQIVKWKKRNKTGMKKMKNQLMIQKKILKIMQEKEENNQNLWMKKMLKNQITINHKIKIKIKKT